MRKLSCVVVLVLAVALLGGCTRKKYETPIANDSRQPDKTLFDRSVGDLERGRYEVARLTLQTMINTYPDSEYLAKAKLAIADSWYRQGGTMALTQAETEYKDFITFFPTMPEAAEAQLKVAMIHYQQMEKADRDATHARRAEDEFKQLLLQFPDSPFKEEAEQRLREVQEVLGEHEFRVGRNYFVLRQNPRASIPRLQDLVNNYPNFSKTDEALMLIGQQFEKGGKDFRPKAGEAYAKVCSDYPLSPFADQAKAKLEEWKLPVPAAKPDAVQRMKYDLEHRQEPGFWGKTWNVFKKSPDVSMASKAGAPILLPTQRAGGEEVAGQPTTEPGAVGISVVPGNDAPSGTAAPVKEPGTTTPALPAGPGTSPTKPPEGGKDAAEAPSSSSVQTAVADPSVTALAAKTAAAADTSKKKNDKKEKAPKVSKKDADKVAAEAAKKNDKKEKAKKVTNKDSKDKKDNKDASDTTKKS